MYFFLPCHGCIGVYYLQVSAARSELTKSQLSHTSSQRDLQAEVDSKTRELERVKAEKTHFENQVASLREEARETKEDHRLQVGVCGCEMKYRRKI